MRKVLERAGLGLKIRSSVFVHGKFEISLKCHVAISKKTLELITMGSGGEV